MSFFPTFKQDSRLGSGLRMGFVLLAFCGLGAGLLWALAASMTTRP